MVIEKNKLLSKFLFHSIFISTKIILNQKNKIDKNLIQSTLDYITLDYM